MDPNMLLYSAFSFSSLLLIILLSPSTVIYLGSTPCQMQGYVEVAMNEKPNRIHCWIFVGHLWGVLYQDMCNGGEPQHSGSI